MGCDAETESCEKVARRARAKSRSAQMCEARRNRNLGEALCGGGGACGMIVPRGPGAHDVFRWTASEERRTGYVHSGSTGKWKVVSAAWGGNETAGHGTGEWPRPGTVSTLGRRWRTQRRIGSGRPASDRGTGAPQGRVRALGRYALWGKHPSEIGGQIRDPIGRSAARAAHPELGAISARSPSVLALPLSLTLPAGGGGGAPV